MKLTPSKIKTLQKIVSNGFSSKVKASAWLTAFSKDTGIGYIQGNDLIITDRDISRLTSFLEDSGYGLDFIDGSVTNSRIDTAKHFEDEKLAKPVTYDRLFIQSVSSFSIDGNQMPVYRAFDAKLEEVIQSNVSQVLIIENLAVFFDLHKFPKVTSLLNDDCLIVYRGDRCYSSKAVNELIEKTTAQVIGFFDFDPASLCCLGIKRIEALILPKLDEMRDRARQLNQSQLFQAQIYQHYNQLNRICRKEKDSRQEYAQLMLDSVIGVTQERLLANEVELIILT